MYHRNIFGSSSKVFGNLRKSSGIFETFRTFSENVRERLSSLRNNFEVSSEIFGRWSEIFEKSSKTPSSACLYNKKNITRRLEDMNFIFSWQKTVFYSLAALVRKILFCHSKIKFRSSRPRVFKKRRIVTLLSPESLATSITNFVSQ